MTAKLNKVSIKNFRSLAEVRQLAIGDISVLFGPNGSGKSTFLDSIWFVRDCAIRGVAEAAASRSHGIGVLYDGAPDDDQSIEIHLETDAVKYVLTFDLADGRINACAGENLTDDTKTLIARSPGSEKAQLYHAAFDQNVPVEKLREPEKLTLSAYLNFNPDDALSSELDQLLHFVRYYHSRSFALHAVKTRGSDSTHHTHLFDRGQNIWSALRNIKDKAEIDDRYSKIIEFMKRAFPDFDGIVFDQTGPNAVYASFLEKGRRNPISASGVSDGHLQMLLLLTALYSEGAHRTSLLLFDEPEISLHPWAIAVLAEAMQLAAADWNKQILIATHSPVLISQFEPNDILAAIVDEGRTSLRRVGAMTEINDLLEEYSIGSLYMSETLAGQSRSEHAGVGE